MLQSLHYADFSLDLAHHMCPLDISLVQHLTRAKIQIVFKYDLQQNSRLYFLSSIKLEAVQH